MIRKIRRSVRSRYIKKELEKGEKEYKIKEDSGRLKYLFQPNKKSDKLLVIFSGFPPKDKGPVYNYVTTLKKIKYNKFFILDDFGNDYRGTFYLGTNENWFLNKEITNLISMIKKQVGVEDNNITLVGSSKGGFSALYYALQNNYGKVIVGEPQILLGDYLTIVPQHLSVFENIMGEYSDKKKERLNRALFDVAEQSEEFPQIFIMCGKGNNYYLDSHIYHFTSYLDDKGIKYDLGLGNFNNHSDLEKHFPKYLYRNLK